MCVCVCTHASNSIRAIQTQRHVAQQDLTDSERNMRYILIALLRRQHLVNSIRAIHVIAAAWQQ